VSLNLVPIIDTMVTLIGFMLFTTSFLVIVGIESPAPIVSTKDVEQKLKQKPLQLTVSIREKDSEIWSPFDRIPAKVIPNVSDGLPDIKAIHEALLDVKNKFPEENTAIIVPSGGITYDVLVSVMDSVRGVDPTDPPMFHKNATTGIDEPLKILFPNVVFGNLLEKG
jgi:biopolymer transport protein ExbD